MMRHYYIGGLAALAFLASAPCLHAQFEHHVWIEYIPFDDMVDVIAGADVQFEWSENTYYDVEITATLYEAFTGPQLDIDWSWGYSGEATSVSVSAAGEYGKDYEIASSLTVYPYFLDQETMMFYDHGNVECCAECRRLPTQSELMYASRRDVWNDYEGGRYPQWVSKEAMSPPSESAWLEVFKILITGPAESEPGADMAAPSVTLTVDMGNNPVQPVNVTLRTSVLSGSGGHTHEGAPRPAARLYKNGLWAQQHTFTTSSRTFTVQFRPSMGTQNTARGIAGQYHAIADFLDHCGVHDHAITVRYYLDPFADNLYSHLRRTDHNHGGGDYHWATTSTNNWTFNAAYAFWDAYGKAQSPVQKMVINDMSLEWGGLFDIYGDWDHPHQAHRDGRNVDIPWQVYTGSGQCTEDPGSICAPKNSEAWQKIKEALELAFDSVEEHNENHFHCTKG